MTTQGNVGGFHSSVASADSAREEHAGDIGKTDNRPTHDQIYLAEKVNARSEVRGRGLITPASLQRWNTVYGLHSVSDALRLLHGFPPVEPVRSAHAYLAGILKGRTL
jgi:hypothetical protein